MAQIHDINKTSNTIERVTQGSKDILDNLDKNIFEHIQHFINRLYSSEYGKYFSDNIFGIPVANWIAAILAFIFIYFFRKILTKTVTGFFLYLSKKTKTDIDDIIINNLKTPFNFFFIIIGIDIFFYLIFLQNNKIVNFIVSSLFIIDLYWVLYAFTPAIHKTFDIYQGRNRDKVSKEFGNFLIRMLRLTIITLGIISLLYNWGVNVTGLIASLGLVGMALAFAAKDTASNLFGSIALMMDRSIKIGEWIKVNGVEGIVEDIGMRTTKIRTFEKSFVVVPNSIVANTNIENFSRRGIRRIKMVIGLTYDTSPEQIRVIVRDIEDMLKSHHRIAHDQTLLVRFDRFDDSSLGIFIYTFTNTADWAVYLAIKEDVNIKIMEIVRANGSDFAFPSQSIYVEKFPNEKNNTKSLDII